MMYMYMRIYVFVCIYTGERENLELHSVCLSSISWKFVRIIITIKNFTSLKDE